MHIILRAAMVAVSLGSIGPAYAGEGEGGSRRHPSHRGPWPGRASPEAEYPVAT